MGPFVPDLPYWFCKGKPNPRKRELSGASQNVFAFILFFGEIKRLTKRTRTPFLRPTKKHTHTPLSTTGGELCWVARSTPKCSPGRISSMMLPKGPPLTWLQNFGQGVQRSPDLVTPGQIIRPLCWLIGGIPCLWVLFTLWKRPVYLTFIYV